MIQYQITLDSQFWYVIQFNLLFLTSSFILGDKWLVSCLGVLHLSKGLFYRVVPADQGFGNGEPSGSPTSEYAGVFRFRLWWCGAWVEVLVDDRLPAVHGRLAFVQSRHSDQFWPALLEKAYAKWVVILYNYYSRLLDHFHHFPSSRLVPSTDWFDMNHLSLNELWHY